MCNILCRLIPLEERSRAVAFVFGGLSVGSVAGYVSLNVVINRAYNETLLYYGHSLRFEWIHEIIILKCSNTIPVLISLLKIK